jgi:TAP-like protein
VRALTLDGAVNIVSHPIRDFRRRAVAFEDALDRFLAACRIRPDHCGLGAAHPRAAYDALAKRLDRRPLPAPGAADPDSVDGEDLRAATYGALTQKTFWPTLSDALVGARAGDGTLLRAAADLFYDTIGVFLDPYVAISALDGRWPRKPKRYFQGGRRALRKLPHFWWQAGYAGLPIAQWPVRPRGAYFGPVENARGATTALVVGTTHDPSTPYLWARRMTAELGNARLLTMRGDGHTASFNNNTTCIDDAVLAYLEELILPAKGKTCAQDVPFVTGG